MSDAEEVKLFDAPDLAALQRNWPRIALRAGVLVSLPVLVALLAKSLDLYGLVSSIPLPLDFLRAGPFAYEGKVIAAIVAVLLGLAYLVPKRTPQLVIGVCVAAILWTGHVFISLQWARLFATDFHFRQESLPGPLSWVWATLLLAVGIVYLLVENLLETRAQQEGRKLSAEDTRALFEVNTRALSAMLVVGAGIALALVLAYMGLRALLSDARLPFRLNPVFVLFGMGLALAVLVALAARRRSPVGDGALPLFSPAPTPTPVPAALPIAMRQDALPHARVGAWARMSKPERIAVVIGAVAIPLLFLPWTGTHYGDYPARDLNTGIGTGPGIAMLFAAIVTLATYLRAGDTKWRRFGPPALWALAMVPYPFSVVKTWNNHYPDPIHTLEFGIYLGFLVALAALSATLFAARRPASSPPLP